MTPERLKSWQPDADREQLAAFIRQNVSLFQHLDECWRRFVAGQTGSPAESEGACSDVPSEMSGQEDDADAAGGISLLKSPDGADVVCPSDTSAESSENEVRQDEYAAAVSETVLEGEDEAVSDGRENETPPPDFPPTQETDMPILPQKPQPTPVVPTMPKPAALPNARQGEYYEAALPAGTRGLQFECGCGLAWDEARQLISGIPDMNGEVGISYHREENGILHPMRQTLYINPDPKSLWQNLPSDKNDLYYKPDNEHKQEKSPHGTLAAARVRGRSHAHIGTFCDDDFAVFSDPASDLHLLAVADGAGSAANARYGSQLAVQAVADTVKTLLADAEKSYRNLAGYNSGQQQALVRSLLELAVYQAVADQNAAAKKEQLPLKSLACTLLAALCLPQADGTWFTAIYQVGDGAVAVWLPKDGKLALLGEGDSGSYSGETCFLSAQEVSVESLQKRIRTVQTPVAPVLVLMTDGVSDPKFETDANLAKPEKWQAFWQEVCAVADDAASLEEWLQFWSPGNHDDRTLAVFIPHEAEVSDNP